MILKVVNYLMCRRLLLLSLFSDSFEILFEYYCRDIKVYKIILLAVSSCGFITEIFC